MEYISLNNGVKMPILGYGVYQVTKEKCERCVLDALKVGYRAIDTAQSYFNEEEVGNAIQKSGIPREEIFLTTKVWVEHYGYEEAKKSVLESMKKLKTDYLDLVLLHQPFSDAYGAYHALEDLYDEGKIRAIGASNVTEDIIKGYCSLGQLDVIQEKYSILDSHIRSELAQVCEENKVSIQAYSPLEQGLLTGKVKADVKLAKGDVRNRNRFFSPENLPKVMRLLEHWKPLCLKYNCTMSNLVIACTAKTIDGLHVLCGARKPEQIRDNSGALLLTLEQSDIDRMLEDVKNEGLS